MHNDIKTSRYYDGAAIRRFVMLMEQFWALANDPALSDDNKKAAMAMYQHCKRMVLCIAAKEMPSEHNFGRIIDEDYMKKMYDVYSHS